MNDWIAALLAIAVFLGFIWVMKNRKNLKKAVSDAVDSIKDKVDEAKK